MCVCVCVYAPLRWEEISEIGNLGFILQKAPYYIKARTQVHSRKQRGYTHGNSWWNTIASKLIKCKYKNSWTAGPLVSSSLSNYEATSFLNILWQHLSSLFSCSFPCHVGFLTGLEHLPEAHSSGFSLILPSAPHTLLQGTWWLWLCLHYSLCWIVTSPAGLSWTPSKKK